MYVAFNTLTLRQQRRLANLLDQVSSKIKNTKNNNVFSLDEPSDIVHWIPTLREAHEAVENRDYWRIRGLIEQIEPAVCKDYARFVRSAHEIISDWCPRKMAGLVAATPAEERCRLFPLGSL